MCVIIVKQTTAAPKIETLTAAANINPHGLGILWLDTWELIKTDSSNFNQLLTDRPYIAHFRYATVGEVTPENCHPFPAGENEVLFQNGTVPNLGSKTQTDTEALGKLLSNIPRKDWAKLLNTYNCRFLTANIENKTFQRYNKKDWTTRNGIHYSKKNVLDLQPLAVYGTLKRGFSNFYGYLQQSTFLGSGFTRGKFRMIQGGSIPFVLPGEHPDGGQIAVDLFLVDKETLKDVDLLEGHPNWYKREKTIIDTQEGEEIDAWLYFNPNEPDKGEYLTDFQPHYNTHSYWDSYNSRYFFDDVAICPDCGGSLVEETEHFGDIYCQDCLQYPACSLR